MKQRHTYSPPQLGATDIMELAAWYYLVALNMPFGYSTSQRKKICRMMTLLLNNSSDPYAQYLHFFYAIRKIKDRSPNQFIRVSYDDLHFVNRNEKESASSFILRSLAESLLDIFENPGLETQRFWVNWFTEHQADEELCTFILALKQYDFVTQIINHASK